MRVAADPELPEIFVQPGESRVTHGAAILRTVLGSCVGITFWNSRLGIGALCHPMLPCCRNAAGKEGSRYVDFTIRDLKAQFDQFGVRRAETVVKLFGGADVLLMGDRDRRPTVGRLNSEMALRVLRDEGFGVAASSLGGRSGIHIQFYTVTGEVLLRRFGNGD